MTDATVVVPCRNGARTLGETLRSIVTQQWDRPWEVVFVDNGSTDGSAEIFDAVVAGNPQLPMRRIDASDRSGKARALNFAIPQARSRAILLVDSDDVVAPGWLAAMATALDESDLVAAATDYRQLNEPWVLEYRLPDADSRERLTETYSFVYHTIPFVSGHCMGFSRRLFDALGGFAENYVVGDDVDFSFRAQLQGYPIRSVPAAVVHYRFRDSLSGLRRQAHLYAFDQARLCQRFPEVWRPVPARWRAFRRETRQLGRRSGRFLLSRQWRDRTETARLLWRWGWNTGLVRGMIAFRAPPP
jgi:glycosyltransferase involved in cell wall biosynthesis